MIGSLCKFQSYKKEYKDELNQKQIYCSKNQCLCYGQRYCTEQHKWIVSERAKYICKDFKEL